MPIFKRQRTAGFAGIMASLSLFIVISVWFLSAVTVSENHRNIRKLFPFDIVVRAETALPLDEVFTAPETVNYTPIPRFSQIFNFIQQQNGFTVSSSIAAGSGVILGTPPGYEKQQNILLLSIPLLQDEPLLTMTKPLYHPRFIPDPVLYEMLKSDPSSLFVYLDSTSPDQNLSMHKLMLPPRQRISDTDMIPGFSSYAFIDQQSFYKIFQRDSTYSEGNSLNNRENNVNHTVSIQKLETGDPRSLPFLFSLPGTTQDNPEDYRYLLTPSYIFLSLTENNSTPVELECEKLQAAFHSLGIPATAENSRSTASPFINLMARSLPLFIFFVVFFFIMLILSFIGYTPAQTASTERLHLRNIYKQIVSRMAIYIILGIVWGILFSIVYCGWGESSVFDFTALTGVRPPAVTEFPFAGLAELCLLIAVMCIVTVHTAVLSALIPGKSGR